MKKLIYKNLKLIGFSQDGIHIQLLAEGFATLQLAITTFAVL